MVFFNIKIWRNIISGCLLPSSCTHPVWTLTGSLRWKCCGEPLENLKVLCDNWMKIIDETIFLHSYPKKVFLYKRSASLTSFYDESDVEKLFFFLFFIVNTLLLYRIQINTWLYRHKNLLMCNIFSLDLYVFFLKKVINGFVSVGLCLTTEVRLAVWSGAHDGQRARSRALVERT